MLIYFLCLKYSLTTSVRKLFEGLGSYYITNFTVNDGLIFAGQKGIDGRSTIEEVIGSIKLAKFIQVDLFLFCKLFILFLHKLDMQRIQFYLSVIIHDMIF